MSENNDLCSHCCAPRQAGFAACKYCKTPFVRNTQTGAIPCPKCATLNELGVQRCVQCQTWIVVQCIFCHALSPHNLPACQRCNEPFAGAPQRFQQRQEHAQNQQRMQVMGTVGTVAASLLGAAAGAAIGGHYGHGGHHHYGHGGYAHRHEDGGFFDSSGDSGSDGGEGGGIMDSLFGGGDSGGATGSWDDSGSSSDGGDGGGIMDSLFGGDDS